MLVLLPCCSRTCGVLPGKAPQPSFVVANEMSEGTAEGRAGGAGRAWMRMHTQPAQAIAGQARPRRAPLSCPPGWLLQPLLAWQSHH